MQTTAVSMLYHQQILQCLHNIQHLPLPSQYNTSLSPGGLGSLVPSRLVAPPRLENHVLSPVSGLIGFRNPAMFNHQQPASAGGAQIQDNITSNLPGNCPVRAEAPMLGNNVPLTGKRSGSPRPTVPRFPKPKLLKQE